MVGSKGEIISTRRKYDVFDLFRRESCELPLFTTRPLIVEANTGYKQMDRKSEWMKGEIEKELKAIYNFEVSNFGRPVASLAIDSNFASST